MNKPLSFQTMKAVQIYAHRGGAGLYPENTLPAFEHALALGVHCLDLDVVLTKDNIIVVYHDRRLHPAYTRDQQKNWLPAPGPWMHQLNYHQLRNFDVGRLDPNSDYAQQFPHQTPIDGTYIPTLREVIQLVKRSNDKKIKLQIELKSDPTAPQNSANPKRFVETLIDTIGKEAFQKRVEVHSFDWNLLKLLQHDAPDIPVSFISAETEEAQIATPLSAAENIWHAQLNRANFESIPDMLSAIKARRWCPYYKDINQDVVRYAHKLGIKVIPWTADDAKTLSHLIHMGVDGIITNRPDRLRDMLEEYGHPVPQKVSTNRS